jgi:perosamine synthetase
MGHSHLDIDIPQMEPWFGTEEVRAVADYMRSGGWVTEFKKTREFEDAIAAYTGAKHCIVTNNGTISLTLAALAVGIKAGDDVIVPNYTMIATPNAVLMFGANPVMVDVESSTLCLDIERVKVSLTPKTRAIVLVTANGRYPSAGIKAFEKLARERGLILIEDSAQGLGSRYPDGRHVGTAGLVGTFSFSAPKIISTGQGGCIITNDDSVAQRLRQLKDFGRSSGGNDIHDTIGWNFKFTDVQAVIGIEQMKKLVWRVERKKKIWRAYAKNLQGLDGIRLFSHDLEHTVPWFIDCLCNDRESFQGYLRERGVGTRIMYPPINQQAAYQRPGVYPVSTEVGQCGLWLPSASQLNDDQVAYICCEIKKFYGVRRYECSNG